MSLLCAVCISGNDFNPATRQIDESYLKIWNEHKIIPAPLCTDQEFIRRAFLDITGRIPREDQALSFLNSPDPEKRSKLIGELLTSPGYAEYFSSIWTALFLGYKDNDVLRRQPFQEWLQSKFQKDEGWDRITRDLITAEGSLGNTPELNWYAKHQMDAAGLADDTSRLFLGIQLGCARCHNHPHDRWKLEDFYGIAAFYAGLRKDDLNYSERRKLKELRAERQEMRVKYKTGGEAIEKEPGRVKKIREGFRDVLRITQDPLESISVELHGQEKTYPAKFLLEPVPAHQTEHPRAALASWITSSANPFFARAFVNRVWSMMMGRGFVQPVDDMGGLNDNSNAELLNFLADDFVRHNYSIKYLVETIANSRVYQLSSVQPHNSDHENADPYYSRGKVMMMNADQLFHSFMTATRNETSLRESSHRTYEERKQMIYDYYAALFTNDDTRQNVDFEGTIPQALFLLNGRFTNDEVQPQYSNTMTNVLRETGFQNRMNHLFLSTLSRYPTTAELQTLGKKMKSDTDYENLFWALLNSNEFLFNH